MTTPTFARGTLAGTLAVLLSAGMALGAPVITHSTSFTGFTQGSVNGQGGWGVTNPGFDQEVVNLGGNSVLRLSNRVTSGGFGDQVFAPRPGGTAMTAADPTGGQPQFFAGESSTGAEFNRFSMSLDFRSVATDGTDLGARITFSPDNGLGARQGFIALENVAAGVQVSTFDVAADGTFIGQVLGTFDFGEWVNLTYEIDFNDGIHNDVARILLNDTLVATINSWESYFAAFESTRHPNGVPVQTVLFRMSGTAVPDALGFYIDNVVVTLDNAAVPVPEPGTLALLGLGVAGLLAARRRRNA